MLRARVALLRTRVDLTTEFVSKRSDSAALMLPQKEAAPKASPRTIRKAQGRRRRDGGNTIKSVIAVKQHPCASVKKNRVSAVYSTDLCSTSYRIASLLLDSTSLRQRPKRSGTPLLICAAGIQFATLCVSLWTFSTLRDVGRAFTLSNVSQPNS